MRMSLLAVVVLVVSGCDQPGGRRAIDVERGEEEPMLSASFTVGAAKLLLTSTLESPYRKTILRHADGRELARVQTDLRNATREGTVLGRALRDAKDALGSPEGQLVAFAADEARQLAEDNPGRYENVTEHLLDLSRAIAQVQAR
jgi:hypothetical protein